ncbi:hypothetical protein K435DRAFT_791253 [Dendrothele bispora CBS 962.96]|uniref:Uncharacterized protein n=1 Tax=Dendrothele bispora (strain CBS 962.96) TaxID=1314807 RepID=A0A4S8MP51_DENBC|nr:hypothetical protein K435DRAFT_791253 [Dendrothele bispora CBS 962.96]
MSSGKQYWDNVPQWEYILIKIMRFRETLSQAKFFDVGHQTIKNQFPIWNGHPNGRHGSNPLFFSLLLSVMESQDSGTAPPPYSETTIESTTKFGAVANISDFALGRLHLSILPWRIPCLYGKRPWWDSEKERELSSKFKLRALIPIHCRIRVLVEGIQIGN